MIIEELTKNPDINLNKKLNRDFSQFDDLLTEIRKKDLPDGIVIFVNEHIAELNSASASERELRKKIGKVQAAIIKQFAKELKIVPKNYYRNIWMAIGMAGIGIPIGAAIGTSLDNMAFLGIGLPIGIALGLAIGSGMDKKAYEEGRQLDVEIKN